MAQMRAPVGQERSALRERILAATVRVVREHGLARTRTSLIAREAGCAEGSIYRHFSDKGELLLEAVRSQVADSAGRVALLPERAGTGSVRANVVAALRVAMSSCHEVFPLVAGVFGDSELLAEQRRLSRDGDFALLTAVEPLAAYLAAERDLGRLGPGTDVDRAAELIVDGCLGAAFRRAWLDGEESAAERERYVETLVDTVLGGAR